MARTEAVSSPPGYQGHSLLETSATRREMDLDPSRARLPGSAFTDLLTSNFTQATHGSWGKACGGTVARCKHQEACLLVSPSEVVDALAGRRPREAANDG